MQHSDLALDHISLGTIYIYIYIDMYIYIYLYTYVNVNSWF
jgi:hypothetical protein